MLVESITMTNDYGREKNCFRASTFFKICKPRAEYGRWLKSLNNINNYSLGNSHFKADIVKGSYCRTDFWITHWFGKQILDEYCIPDEQKEFFKNMFDHGESIEYDGECLHKKTQVVKTKKSLLKFNGHFNIKEIEKIIDDYRQVGKKLKASTEQSDRLAVSYLSRKYNIDFLPLLKGEDQCGSE